MQRNLKNEKKARCRKNVNQKNISLYGKALIYFLLKIALCLKQTSKKPNQTPQLKPKATQQRACIIIRLSESSCRKRLQVRYIRQMLRGALFSILQAVLRVINRVWLLP